MDAKFQELFEGKIDFQGQKLTDQILHYVMISATVVSFIIGFVLQSLSATFATFGVSVLFLSLVIVPPWPMYNAHPVKWLPSAGDTKKTS